MSAPLLVIRNLETWYGPVCAIRGVSLSVAAGRMVAVLGANGAGKTTLLNTIATINRFRHPVSKIRCQRRTECVRQYERRYPARDVDDFADGTAPRADTQGNQHHDDDGVIKFVHARPLLQRNNLAVTACKLDLHKRCIGLLAAGKRPDTHACR